MSRVIATFLLLGGWIAVQPAHSAVITGNIAAHSVNGGALVGYLDLTAGQDRYLLNALASANILDLDTSASSPFSLLDQDAPASHRFFAGLISPGIELLTTNSNAAILGDSPVTTSPGSTPQSGGSVSIPGAEYESAIWSRSGSDLSLRWVNHDGSSPATTTVWDPVGQTLYLTANPAAVILNHPGSQAVNLVFTGTIPTDAVPEPSSFALFSVALGGILFRQAKKAA